MNRVRHLAAVLTVSLLMSVNVHAQQNTASSMSPDIGKDTRMEVVFPPLVKHETLANMRMHLKGVTEIQQALADKDFEKAAHLATMYLGMSSPTNKNSMKEEVKYMPQGMMRLGAEMHHKAAEFAVEAQDAEVTGDLESPLRALSQVTHACVACHSAYKLH